MSQPYTGTYTLSYEVPQWKRTATDWEKLPPLKVRSTVQLTIDVESIAAWLCRRAAENKNGKAVFLGGDIVAKRLSREVIP